jgi:hypothetical protein
MDDRGESIPHRAANENLRQIRRADNNPLYRLVNLTFNNTTFKAEFALNEYYRYLFIPGLLHDELVQAIRTAGFDINRTVSQAAELLPLRQQLLPDGAAVVNFPGRLCIGGIIAIFAIARPHPPSTHRLRLSGRGDSCTVSIVKSYYISIWLCQDSRHLGFRLCRKFSCVEHVR